VDNYIVFAGGYTGSGASNKIDVFRVNPETGALSVVSQSGIALSAARTQLASAVVGNYVIFAGGDAGSSKSAVINVFSVDPETGALSVVSNDKTLTAGVAELTGVSLVAEGKGYAVFAGGTTGSSYSNAIDVFTIEGGVLSDNLNPYSSGTKLKEATASLAAAAYDDIVVFAGGYNGIPVKMIDVLRMGRLNEVTVKFAFADGDHPDFAAPHNPVIVDYGVNVVPPSALIAPNYSFVGWYIDKEAFWTYVTVPAKKAMCLYAKYEHVVQ
jgi:hypothetical protein